MMNRKVFSVLAVIAMLFSAATAHAKGPGKSGLLYNPNTPSLMVINTISDVSGSVGGFIDSNGDFNGDMFNPDNVTIVYPISGKVYATMTDGRTGETMGSFSEVGTISATASFSTAFFGLMNPDWGALPATLPWTMSDDFAMVIGGTTFTFEEELTGRAFPHLGPVENSTETMALRMSGCAGLRTDGQGDYAGKVGTLCLNGTFTFDQYFNGAGVSNCSIAIHNPLM